MYDPNQEQTSSGYDHEKTVKILNKYYGIVKRQILRYQSPISGLFPLSCHTDSAMSVTHVRDSLYCAMSVFALSQSYKRIDDDQGRTHELMQTAVKCMRGILSTWILQADKLEKFKLNQLPRNALHCKFELDWGEPLPEEDYDHLQIDCVALFLIFLTQMITAGLQIIFTTDEVNFVQNLVFYVERAYRTPDFGMWERGSKYNNGSTELHASSIGLAKAALESVNGANLFGAFGSSWSIVYIDIDAHYRNRTNFDTLLPRESASKNSDSSLIPTVSWPAFAIHEENLVKKTIDKVKRKLQGKYGFKRFLRDGYGTVVEDRTRKHYRPAEIKEFDGVECEWPIFLIYLIIDSIYKNDMEAAKEYRNMLQPLLREARGENPNGDMVVPKYYYVPSESIEDERRNPHSQMRLASCDSDRNELFLWGQSVFIIAELLLDKILSLKELDPIGRSLPAAIRPRPHSRYSSFQSSPSDLVIQVVLVSESIRLQQLLATYGIKTQTPHQIEPIQIWSPNELVRVYERLGPNEKMNLTGRPPRPIGGLGTAKIYRACGKTFLCYPLLFELSDFYLSQDIELMIDDIKSDIKFLGKCWKLAGRPTFCMIIREDNVRGDKSSHIFELLAQFKRGECDGVKVRLGRLQEFVQSACIEHLDFLTMDADYEDSVVQFKEVQTGKQFQSLMEKPESVEAEKHVWAINEQELSDMTTHDLATLFYHATNMCLQAQILQLLRGREGLYHRMEVSQTQKGTVEENLEILCHKAGRKQLWDIVRFCSSLLSKMVDSLAPSITAILVRGKQVTIGLTGQDEEVIDKPLSPNEIKHILYSKCYPNNVQQAVLQQEIIIYIGKFISTNPHMFDGILKIRIGWILRAMELELKYQNIEKPIVSMSPSGVKRLLEQVVKKCPENDDYRGILWNRQLNGALNRVPLDFYECVWQILEHAPSGIKVVSYHLMQQPTLSDMTQYELNFSLLVEQMLSKIESPAYRQIMVETLMILSTILKRNPELSFTEIVNMDKFVNDGFILFADDQIRRGKNIPKDGMSLFLNTPPNQTAGTTAFIAKAIINHLLEGEIDPESIPSCVLS